MSSYRVTFNNDQGVTVFQTTVSGDSYAHTLYMAWREYYSTFPDAQPFSAHPTVESFP